MPYVDFIARIHNATKRDYLKRVVEHDKAASAEIACQFGKDYWDGERQFGYGGYRYDGRWRSVANLMAKHYCLKAGDRLLDIGCGKGFLLYDFTQSVPGIEVAGIDVSTYAIENAKSEVKPYLQVANATKLPFPDQHFDLVYSINTLHNLYNYELWSALAEFQRVGKKHRHIVVEGYRTEREKVNLLYWQLTCRTFYTPAEWEWLYKQAGCDCDYSFIFFE